MSRSTLALMWLLALFCATAEEAPAAQPCGGSPCPLPVLDVPAASGYLVQDWAPAPSLTQVKYLMDQAAQASKLRLDAEQKLSHLAPWIEKAQHDAQVGKELQMKAAQELSEAQKLAEIEDRRVRSLPSLVAAAQMEAGLQRQKRIEAEERAKQAELVRLESQRLEEKRLEQVKQMVDRRRMIDRLQAAEDARVLRAATDAAEEVIQARAARLAAEYKANWTAKVINETNYNHVNKALTEEWAQRPPPACPACPGATATAAAAADTGATASHELAGGATEVVQISTASTAAPVVAALAPETVHLMQRGHLRGRALRSVGAKHSQI